MENKNTAISSHTCSLYKKDHNLDECQEFMDKSIANRSKFLANTKLCLGAICKYPLITKQRVVKRHEFEQAVKNNTQQAFMDTSTQGKEN